MFIDKNGIKLYKSKNSSALNISNYLTEVKYGYNKLWSSDSGRNLAGTQTGTLVGIFPKLTLSFRKLTKAELEALIPYLDKGNQWIRYYDPRKKKYIRMKTYTGDYEITNKRIINSNNKNESFNISFIAIAPRYNDDYYVIE